MEGSPSEMALGAPAAMSGAGGGAGRDGSFGSTVAAAGSADIGSVPPALGAADTNEAEGVDDVDAGEPGEPGSVRTMLASAPVHPSPGAGALIGAKDATAVLAPAAVRTLPGGAARFAAERPRLAPRTLADRLRSDGTPVAAIERLNWGMRDGGDAACCSPAGESAAPARPTSGCDG